MSVSNMFYVRSSKEECEVGCLGKNMSALPTEVCDMPLEYGPCEGNFTRWGSKGGVCVPFTYGGCCGNNNNYR